MASDPYDQRHKMANMHISGASPGQQIQQQPPYDARGSNPSTVTTAPAYTPYATGFAAPTGQAPVQPVPVSPMQAPPMQQPAPPPMQSQVYQQTYPPPFQAQQPQVQYYPPPASVPNQANASYAAPVYPSQAPPPQGSSSATYDPFAPAPAPARIEPDPVVPSETQGSTAPHADEIEVTDTEADFWATMGFAVQETPAANAAVGSLGNKKKSLRASLHVVAPTPSAEKGGKESSKPEDETALDENGLLASGKYYKVTLGKGYLGTNFVTAEDIGVNLFYSASESFTKTLKNRPIVAYTSTNSVVDKAKVSVGDVLIKVRDKNVDDPESAMYAIRDVYDKNPGAGGLVLHMWKPPSSIHVTHAENQCVVEYHSKSVEVPRSNSEWKSKYVVIGGIAAEPWEMKMYYNKSDYDKAIKDMNENKYKPSVKVKTWSFIGARVITVTPRTVHYMLPGQTSKRPWYYIVVQLKNGKAIKIGHPLVKGIEPVADGVNKAIEYAETYKPFSINA